MTIYLWKIGNNLGTFKSRFYDYAIENGGREVHNRGLFNLESEGEPLIVLTNSKLIGFNWLLRTREKTSIVNFPESSWLSKPDVGFVAASVGVKTPDFIINPGRFTVNRKMVIKPLRGQGGMGIRLRSGEVPPGFFAQEFIPSPFPDFVFDMRIYVFLGTFLGSTVRISTDIDSDRFGLTNTHQDGSLIYFERNLKPRCPSMHIRGLYERVVRWTGCRGASEKIKEDAIKMAKALNLSYCGIDFIFDGDGNHYVIDVNPNAMHGYRTTADRIRMERAWEIAKGRWV